MNKKAEKVERLLNQNHFTPKQIKQIVKLMNEIKEDVIDETYKQIVYMMIALMDISLVTVRHWKPQTIQSFNKSMAVILSEVDRELMTPEEVVYWAEQCTGIDIEQQLKNLEEGQNETE